MPPFIDDFGRKVWIYFLKHKNEVFVCFKPFELLIESQTGEELKRLRTDHMLEEYSNEFNDICRENDGSHQGEMIYGTPNSQQSKDVTVLVNCFRF